MRTFFNINTGSRHLKGFLRKKLYGLTVLGFLLPGIFSSLQADTSSFELLLPDRVGAISPDARPEIESQVFHLINKHRKSKSLPLLKWASMPAHCARQHSLDMARGVVPFGHDGFNDRFNQIRAAMPSVTSMGENVAWNRGFSNPAQVAVDGWLSSPGHLANIEGDYNFSGVGVGVNASGQYYFTQIFVKADAAAMSDEEEEVSFESCVYGPPVQIEVE